MNTELAVTKPAELYRTSTDVAGLCKEFVVSSAVNIQGKKFVKVEGWQSIAAAHGCIAEIEYVKEANIQGVNGIEACALLRRMSDGAIISRANGFVGQDEKSWATRGAYARYAMAQTRATSRVCRNAFAYVVVMMNAGLETTPAEEVPNSGFEKSNGGPTPVQAWARETKEAIAKPVTQDLDGQKTVQGVLGPVTTSQDGGAWFIDSIGELKKGLWTRDKELADTLHLHEGTEIVAQLQAKKPGSYRVVSFQLAEDPSDD